MLQVAKKRGQQISLYQQDMTKFRINKNYDAILILNSGLVLLSNHEDMRKTLFRCYLHLKDKGIILLDLPNHKVEIKENNFSQEHKQYFFPKGTINVIFRDYKNKDKWISEWHSFVREDQKFAGFNEYYEEFIYDPKQLELDLKSVGFKILKIFGTRRGGLFNPEKSYRKFYLCQKAY